MSASSEIVADTGSEVAETIDLLRAGTRLVALRVSNPERRAASLEAIVGMISDPGTKIVWIGNPLRSPLTIERVFLQAVGADADLRFDRSPADLAQMLARSAGECRRLVLILQQPETLDAEARDAIGALAPRLPDDPAVQFLFSGTDAFRLPPPPAQFVLPIVSEPEPASVRRWEAIPLLLLLAILVVGAGLSLWPRDRVSAPAAVATSLGAVSAPSMPAPFMPTPPVSAPTVFVPSASLPPAVDVAALRREFDAFLTQRAPTMVPLNDTQKNALFEEFMERRRQKPSQDPT